MRSRTMKLNETNSSLLILSVFAFFLAALLCLVIPLRAGAEDAPTPQKLEKSDRLDVTDLEHKYWAAKDTDFSVVQNRTYTKANRLFLSVSYGTLINDAWSDAGVSGASVGYFFNDRSGLELNFTSIASRDNKSVEKLKSQNGFPNHGKLTQYYGASFNWVPLYAKMSALNASIIYFDMAISPGVGMTQYEQQIDLGNRLKNAPTVSLDVSQQFFLNRSFALRFDFKNRWFQEETASYRQIAGHSADDRTLTTDMSHTTILMFGLTYFH